MAARCPFSIKGLKKARLLEDRGIVGSIRNQFGTALNDIEKFLEEEPPASPAQPEDEAGDLAGPHGPEAHRPSAGEAVSESGSDEESDEEDQAR